MGWRIRASTSSTSSSGWRIPLNQQHLIKLVGFDFPPRQRQHFRRELRILLEKLQRLRLKPNNRTGSVKFFYDLLFDYPFGGVEVQNMRILMQLIADEYDGISRQNHRSNRSTG